MSEGADENEYRRYELVERTGIAEGCKVQTTVIQRRHCCNVVLKRGMV